MTSETWTPVEPAPLTDIEPQGHRTDGSFAEVPLSDRFWKRVDNKGDCWLWIGARRLNGYGYLDVRLPRRRKLLAHRLAWELVRGPVPAGLFVCHHCDVRHCVRVSHLFLGTASDNAQDCHSKGRHPQHGDRSPNHKLSDSDVRRLRSKYATGESTRSLGVAFGISTDYAWAVATGRLRRRV